MKKKKLWIAILVAFVVLVSSVVYLNRAVIFQRGNPIPYLTAAAQISEKNPYVAVDEAKGIYISKRGECPELLEYYQEKTGMEFVEQAGSSYLFTDGSRNEVASSEVYWGRYTVWVLPTMEAAENADAEQYDAKPVIYLYPEKQTAVTVKLNYAGELTCTYPAYNDGWKVSASPDGTLTDADGQTYNYLYWEGVNSVAYDFSEGFCVAGSDTAAFLENALNQLGLTRKEANEFIVYWLPLMKENSIDYAAETITVSDGYEVNTDSGFGTGTVVTSGSTVTPGQTFHVRKAASGDIPASEGTEFTIPARPDAPAAPTVKSKTSGSVTLEVILGAQYSMDGGATWQDSPEFTGLSASTAYRFVARYGATESRFASLASAELNVTTNAALSGGGYTYYTIKATAGVNGAISPSGSVSVREGRNQTFTITPNTGYAISNVKIDGKSVGAVKSYTFENVKGNHTIEAIFMKANGNPQTGVFVDVPEGSYYEEAVAWAVENGITQGTDDTHFSPDGICTRAQAVTFLWRTAGSPASKTSAMPFTDVPVGSYYYDAVLWAVENGITKGTSETRFSPDDTCTRAQIVAFLWRSEKSPAAGSRNPFADVKSTAYYADAVLWAVKEDITKGTTNTTFSPDADCTRAQIVTFLWRCKK